MKYAKLEYPPQGRSLVRTFCRERVVSRGKVFERKKKKKNIMNLQVTGFFFQRFMS